MLNVFLTLRLKCDLGHTLTQGTLFHLRKNTDGFNFSLINPLSPNSVQDQFSPYNYPYTVKR